MGQALVKLVCTDNQFNYANNLKEGTSIWITFTEKHSSKVGWEIVEVSISKPN